MSKQANLSKKYSILSRINTKLNSAVILSNVIIAVGLVPALMGPIGARAATVTWIGSGVNWSDPTNWSTGTLPGSSDDVIVYWTGQGTAQSGPQVDHDVTLKTLTVGGDGLNGRVGFAHGQQAVLTVSGETILQGGPFVAWIEVDQATGAFHANGDITISNLAATTTDPSVALNVENGGQMQVNNNAIIKVSTVAGARGAFTIQDQNSYASVAEIIGGHAGHASVNVVTNGQLDSGKVTLGNLAGSNGRGRVQDSGKWNLSDELIVGNAGTGLITIASGGQLTLNDTSKNIIVASQSGSTGTLAIGSAPGDSPTTAGKLVGNVSFGSGTGNILFNHSDTQYVFDSSITGAGTIDHNDGATRLTADNSYTGLTNVNGGTLLIDGNHSQATGQINVGAGGSLGGKGTVGGDVVIAQDGALFSHVDGAVSNALTINGNLTASSAYLYYNFNSSTGAVVNNLEINVKGTVDVSNAKVSIISDTPLVAGKHHLLKYNSSINSNGISLVDDEGGKYALKVTDGSDPTDPSVLELISTVGVSLRFWDAINHDNGKVDGGTGTWQADGTLNNWTTDDGATNGAYTNDSFAVFEGTAGTVTVDNSNGVITIKGMQFITDGYVVQNGTLTLDNGVNNIRVNAGATAGISSVLAGSGQLVVTDPGTLKLSGANTYSGGTVVNAGILNVVADNNLGDASGAVEIGSGTLQFGAGLTSARAFSVVHADSSIDPESNSVTLSGAISGDGVLNKLGSGMLVLSGTNTYSGGTNIKAGSISIANDSNLGAATGNLTFSGGSLVVTSNTTLARDIILSSADGNVDTQNNQVTISGSISGEGALIKNGAGSLTLSGINTHSGGTTIKEGTLFASSDQNLGAASGVLTIDNAIFEASANLTISRPVELVGTATIDSGGNQVQIDGVISGDGQLVKSFAGVLTLTAENTFSGGLKIIAGSVSVSSDKNLGASSGNITLSQGALVTTADFSTDRNIILEPGRGFLVPSNHTATYNGVISGVGALDVQLQGTVILTGDNTYTGSTDVSDAKLLINGDRTAATGDVSVIGSGILGGKGTIGGSVTVGASAKLLSFVDANDAGHALHIRGDLTAQNSTLEYDYGQSGQLNILAVQVAGDIDLTGSSIDVTTTGQMAAGVHHLIDYQGTKHGTDPILGNVPDNNYSLRFTPNAVDLIYTAGAQLRFWNPGGNGAPIVGGTGTWQVAGNLDNWTDEQGSVNGNYSNNSFAVFEGQAGTVTVDNSNGAVDVTGMQFITDGYIITGDAITLAAGNNDIRVGDGTPHSSATTVATINAELTGAGRVQKTDAGILILNGQNTYMGGTAINGGTLRVSDDHNLGDASGDVAIGKGKLQYAASFDTNRAISVLDANSTIDTQNFDAGLNGAISGAGGLVKLGSGELSLHAANSFVGRTIVQEGTLSLAGAGTLDSSAGVTVDGKLSIENIAGNETTINDLDGAAAGQVVLGSKNLTIANGQGNEFAGVISGDGQVHLAAGSLIFTGDNTYSGGTVIDSGAALQLGNGAANGSVAGPIQLDGTFDVKKSGDVTLDNKFTGSGTLNLDNATTTTLLTASPDFAGTTNLRSGQLIVDVVHGGMVNVAANTVLSGTGTVGGVQNYGTVKPGSDDAFGTLTVAGNYEGDNGTLLIKTALGADDSSSDMLKITGDTSGNTNVVVQNRGGLGAQTNQGIQIIDVEGESHGAFRLKGDFLTHSGEQAIVAGAYAYTLNEGTSGAQDGNWYLRSQLSDHPHPTPPQPHYNPATPLYTAYGQVLDNLNQSMITSLRARFGQRFHANGLAMKPIEEGSADLGNPSVIWGRIDMAHSRFKPSGSTTRNEIEQDTWRMTAGVDGQLLADEAGEMYGSIWLNYVSDNARVGSRHGRGKLVTDGYGLGGALTWYDENGWYLDAQGHLTWYRTEFESHDTFTSVVDRRKAFGYGLSAEIGQEFKVDENWSVTPQAQLSYSSVDLDSFVDAYEAHVYLDSRDSLVLRAGLAANYRNQWHNDAGRLEKLDVFAIANVYTQLLSQSQGVNISSVRFDTGKMGRSWMEVGAGATYLWPESGVSLFGNASFATAFEDAGDNYRLGGKVGLKVNW